MECVHRYADAQKLERQLDGTDPSEEGSRAYTMLTAAFSPAETGHSKDDLGQIFRIITGHKLRDVDPDGNLIEQLGEGGSPDQVRTSQAFARAETERRDMRSEIDLLRGDVGGLKGSLAGVEAMLKQLVNK